MKPRTAAASFILAAVASAVANKSALYAASQSHKRKSHKSLTTKEKARIDAIAAFYANEITKTLRNVPFEGDTAEVGDSSHDVLTPPADSVHVIEDEAPTSTADYDAGYAEADAAAADQGSDDIGPDNDPLGFDAAWPGLVARIHPSSPALVIHKLTININPTK